jgi:hypothetical protein
MVVSSRCVYRGSELLELSSTITTKMSRMSICKLRVALQKQRYINTSRIAQGSAQHHHQQHVSSTVRLQ